MGIQRGGRPTSAAGGDRDGMAGSRGEPSTTRRRTERRLAPLLGMSSALLLLLALALAAPVGWAAPTVAADSTPTATASATPSGTATPPAPTLTIQVPAAADGTTAEGPVGAYVTVAATGLTAGDTYQLGYALVDQHCASGEQDFTPPLTKQASADGALTQWFAWPRYLQSIGTVYFICLKDTTNTTNPNVQSAQQFMVGAAQAPQITLAPGPGPDGSTPTAGATTFVIGGQAMLMGQNFLPGGEPLKALLLKKQYNNNPADLTSSSAVQLPQVDGTTAITADGSGNVNNTTLMLPATLSAGTYWLYLVSSDGSDTTPPSLLAGQQITVMKPAATPTPTTAATTPTVTLTPSSSGRIVAAVGLSGLSVLLFILGVVLLASAAALPRPPR
jgi:hypothetical protein